MKESELCEKSWNKHTTVKTITTKLDVIVLTIAPNPFKITGEKSHEHPPPPTPSFVTSLLLNIYQFTFVRTDANYVRSVSAVVVCTRTCVVTERVGYQKGKIKLWLRGTQVHL